MTFLGITLTATYDVSLVVLSGAIAVFGSYVALVLATKVSRAEGQARNLWLTGGAITLGLGIWAMHFLGMLAYQLPLPTTYDLSIVLVSMAVAVAGSGAGLSVVSRQQPQNWLSLIVGGLFIGFGIVGLHFAAMSAMRVAAIPLYDPKLIALSTIIAVGLSSVALRLAFHASVENRITESKRKLGSVIFMGTAIVGMHYTAMAALCFQLSNSGNQPPGVATQFPASSSRLAVAVSIATLLILLLALLISFLGQRSSAGATRAEALRQSEERFRSLVQNASDVIAIVAADCTIFYLSPSFNRILGYKPEDWLGRKALELIHPDDFVKAENLLMEARRCPAINLTTEPRLQHADGQTRDFEVIVNNLLAVPSVAGIVLTCRDVTERKQAEEALSRALKEQESIMESVLDIIYVLDLKGNLFRWNKRLETATGLSPEELKGRSALAFFPEVEQPTMARVIKEVFEQGKVEVEGNLIGQNEVLLPYEWNSVTLEDKAGNTIGMTEQGKVEVEGNLIGQNEVLLPYEWNGVTLEDEAGNTIGITGIGRDISERKQAEAQLHESEAKFRSLIQNSSDIIAVLKSDGTMQYASPSHERVLGYELKDLIGKNAFEFVHPDDVTSTFNEFNKLVQNVGGVRRQEFQFQRKDGSWCFLEATGSNLLSDPSVGAIVVNSRDVTERRQAEAQLLHHAFHDALTGLPNRALFVDRLGRAVAHGKRHKDYLLAVLFLDLDRFKVINDSLGHTLGDQLLIIIANRLEACVRPTDTVARLGGDEFTILLEEIEDVSDAVRVAERIQQELTLPFDLEGQKVFTTASIGIALTPPDYQRPEDFLRDADNAMYRAKELGKARYEIFTPSMRTRVVALLQMETELRWAIERQEFRVHYQPIVSLATGRVLAFEALVRWQHPDRGLVFPEEFIPVAEETGLIIPIDQWVLWEACRQTQQWQEHFPSELAGNANLLEARRPTQPTGAPQGEPAFPLTINVNLCNAQFWQPGLLQHITQVLQQTHLDAGSLKLEITENIIMENNESATAKLWQLRDLGIQLVIDDFGTGYSSLSRLHRFPIDMLKIDRSFVSKLGRNGTNFEIIETIVTLARKLGVDVTAEGVETAEQLSQLRELNCEYGQGYFFSKPLDSKSVEALIMLQP